MTEAARDFIRHLTGPRPNPLAVIIPRVEGSAEIGDASKPEDTNDERRAFVRQLTGRSDNTTQEN